MTGVYWRTVGILRDTATQRLAFLPSRAVIGRSRACDIILAERDVSSQHAVIKWTGALWELQDLSSRNGTFVEAHRVGPGERVPLQQGMCVCFARTSNEWTLSDASPPQPMALHLASGRVQLEESGLLMLPNAEQPELLLHEGDHGRWFAERDGDALEVADHAMLTVADELWRVYLSLAGSGTIDADDRRLRVTELLLRFAHSHDEEYIELSAAAGIRRIELEARAHNYVLLLLARARLADQGRGLAPPEQGWIQQEKLLDMLKMESSHLNITIHRARIHLAQNGISDATRLIVRR